MEETGELTMMQAGLTSVSSQCQLDTLDQT